MSGDATWREIVEAPRWAGFPAALKDECFAMGLRLSIEIEKGWFRETVRFEVVGPEAKIARLKRLMYGAMDGYNKGRTEYKKHSHL